MAQREQKFKETESSIMDKEARGTLSLDIRGPLRQQMEDGLFCDVFLKAGDMKMPVHKCVLASVSPYFMNMLAGFFKEKEESEFDMSAVFETGENLEMFVKSIYGDELLITLSNVSVFLRVGDILALPAITSLCLLVLADNLQVSNCLWTWSLAELHSLSELCDVCQDLAMQWFPHCIINTDEALKIPLKFMEIFLKKGLGKYATQENLSSFAQKYFKANPDEVKSFASQLYELANISDEQLTTKPISGDTDLSPKVPETKENFPKEDHRNENKGDEAMYEIKEEESEEILFHPTSTGGLLYSCRLNKWYSLPDITKANTEERQESARRFQYTDDFIPLCFGIGDKSNLILLQKNYKRDLALFDCTTNFISPVPEISAIVTVGKKPKEVRYHYGIQDACCLKKKLLFFSQSEKLSRYNKLQECTTMDILHYDTDKKAFNILGILLSLPVRHNEFIYISCATVHYSNDQIYIILYNNMEIYMKSFQADSCKIEDLAKCSLIVADFIPIGHYDFMIECVGGSPDGVFAKALQLWKDDEGKTDVETKYCNVVQYNIAKQTLEGVDITHRDAKNIEGKIKTDRDREEKRPNVTYSHSEGKAYYFLEKKCKNIVHFISFDMKTKTVTDLAPPPIYGDFEIKLKTSRAPKSFINNILKQEDITRTLQLHKRICSKRDIRMLLAEFGKRTSTNNIDIFCEKRDLQASGMKQTNSDYKYGRHFNEEDIYREEDDKVEYDVNLYGITSSVYFSKVADILH